MRHATLRERIAAAIQIANQTTSWIMWPAVLCGIAWFVVFDNHSIDAIYLYGLAGFFMAMKILHYFDRRLAQIECKLDLINLKPSS
jgi:hypothetical protein